MEEGSGRILVDPTGLQPNVTLRAGSDPVWTTDVPAEAGWYEAYQLSPLCCPFVVRLQSLPRIQ